MAVQNSYTITQASELTGYESHVIRFYEKEFELKIPRNKANHRYFTQKEINELKYIKTLQDRGFSNTQIKLILHSPETVNKVFQDISDVAVSHTITSTMPSVNNLDDILDAFKREITEEFREYLDCANQPLRVAIAGLSDEIKDLCKLLSYKGSNDILCENVNLKIQLKQKSDEIIELKEKLKGDNEKNSSFLSKVFKK